MEPSETEREFVFEARRFLDEPSFMVRVANAIGKPIEGAIGLIPANRKALIDEAVNKALRKGLSVVTSSIKKAKPEQKAFQDATKRSRLGGFAHSAASFGTGAGGGFFGLATLPLELPVTTAIMLRSIAATAQEFGLDINDPEVQLECLYVLSLGSSKAKKDDAMDSAYWTSRVAFSRLISDAAKDVKLRSAPALLRFIAQVAARYKIVVSQKAVAVLVPAIGALGGGLINAAFTSYFSEAARYHFGLRALEKKYGADVVRSVYARSVGDNQEDSGSTTPPSAGPS